MCLLNTPVEEDATCSYIFMGIKSGFFELSINENMLYLSTVNATFYVYLLLYLFVFHV